MCTLENLILSLYKKPDFKIGFLTLDPQNMSLIDHFAEYLGLSPGDITGNHDLAHNMQLAYSDVFRKPGNVMGKLIKKAFTIMSDFNTGKGSTVFSPSCK